MHIVQRVPRQIERRMYLPSERHVVNGVGLGEVDGLFNIGKMFKRMVKITPNSFKLKNIMGAIGSVTAFTATGGLSSLAPKLTGAHSSAMKALGYGVVAVGAVVGGAALLPAGALTGAGGMLSEFGGSILKGGSGLMSMFGGSGKGIPPQQQTSYQAGYAPVDIPPALPEVYGPNVPVGQQLQQTVYPTMPDPVSQGSYSAPADMHIQSPYSPLADETVSQYIDPRTGLMTDPATGNKVDPSTGKVVIPAQAGMLPDFSMTTWMIIGGVTLAGLYVASSSDKTQ